MVACMIQQRKNLTQIFKKRHINETINMTAQIPVTLTESDAIFVYIFV